MAVAVVITDAGLVFEAECDEWSVPGFDPKVVSLLATHGNEHKTIAVFNSVHAVYWKASVFPVTEDDDE